MGYLLRSVRFFKNRQGALLLGKGHIGPGAEGPVGHPHPKFAAQPHCRLFPVSEPEGHKIRPGECIVKEIRQRQAVPGTLAGWMAVEILGQLAPQHRRPVAAQPPQRPGVKALHTVVYGEAVQAIHRIPGQRRGAVPVGLQLHHQRRPSGKQGEHLLQKRDVFL